MVAQVLIVVLLIAIAGLSIYLLIRGTRLTRRGMDADRKPDEKQPRT